MHQETSSERQKRDKKQSEQHGVTRVILQQAESCHVSDAHDPDSKARTSSTTHSPM